MGDVSTLHGEDASLSRRLGALYETAMENGDLDTARRAIMARARLHGFIVDHVEQVFADGHANEVKRVCS